jgi:flagella basal body P-ring formation protein FlgA
VPLAAGRLALLLLPAWPIGTSIAAGAWQSVAEVRRTAEAYALELVGGGPGTSVEAAGLDERLHLPACTAALEAASAGSFANGRGTVEVTCDGNQPWRLFVPVRTTRTVPVVVVGRPLVPGQRLDGTDLRIVERNAAALPYQYFSRVEDVVGQTVRRSLPSGAVLVPAAIEHAALVERGARVTLVARTSSVTVKAEGIALGAAAMNGRVEVRTAVGRVVEGIVEGNGLVRVGP